MLLSLSNFVEDHLFEELVVVKKDLLIKGVTESMIFDWMEWHKRIHVNNPDKSVENP